MSVDANICRVFEAMTLMGCGEALLARPPWKVEELYRNARGGDVSISLHGNKNGLSRDNHCH
jgi:hypothetical protein